MRVVLTQMSDKEYQLIASGQMPPKMAAQYLKEERLEIRTFSSILLEMYHNDDLLLRLIQQFQDDNPEANPRSISKKSRTGSMIRISPPAGKIFSTLLSPCG